MSAQVGTIALAGSPNAGKSSLFNALTGANQKIGNYPGVTVEKKIGTAFLSEGETVAVIDLPGTYSLNPTSPDEDIAVKILQSAPGLDVLPDLIVAVADATNLERTLSFILELKQLNRPILAALNMMDLAERRGLRLDLDLLEKELGVPVVTTVATGPSGTVQLRQRLASMLKQLPRGNAASSAPDLSVKTNLGMTEVVQARFREVDRILARAVKQPQQADMWSERIDRLLLHPVLGGVFLALILLTVFQAVFSWAETPMDLIEAGLGALGESLVKVLPEGLFASFLVDGIIAGVGSVLVFLPQILILFFFIFLLEGSGYMMRAAFIMDRFMAAVGLQGRSFVPLLSSFACAIPGIMAARTIRNPRDRLLTILIAPLMTCSARLPVYVLLIGAFIPNSSVLGIFRLQGLVMFGLFVVGIVSAMAVSLIFKLVALKGPRSPLLMEMPSYKWPNLRFVALSLWQRALVFLKKAGGLILMISVVLWALSTFPQAPKDYEGPAINYSLAGRIGHFVEPVFQPLGFDWRIATGLIPGFAAREVMVGALGTVFAVENADDEGAGTKLLQDQIAATWPLPTGLALLAWYVFAPQCLATFAVARRETNSRKWTSIMFLYMLALAYLAAFAVNQLANLF